MMKVQFFARSDSKAHMVARFLQRYTRWILFFIYPDDLEELLVSGYLFCSGDFGSKR